MGTVVTAICLTVASLAFVELAHARARLLAQTDASLRASQLLLGYVDEETAIRGYILSGNAAFLQPYSVGRAEEISALRRLDTDLAGDATLLSYVHAVTERADTWRTEFASPAVLKVASGANPASSQQALLQSKALFDDIRNAAARLDAALHGARDASVANLDSATTLLIWVLAISVFLLVVAGGTLTVALRKWVIVPLYQLSGDARQVAGGDIDHRISPVGPPELSAVGEDIESMRSRITKELAAVTTARSELAAANKDLERSNRDLEQFAYVASHDLQEPLRKVTSFVQLLHDRYHGQLDERADKYTEFAVDGAKRMQQLIQDLLAFSRVGHSQKVRKPVDLNSAFSDAVENLQVPIRESGATVTAESLPRVNGDSALLTTLWQNLISNSIKFHGDDPPVVCVEIERHGPVWLCTVSDNGMGIEPRYAEKVFLIFQRLHSREQYPGTGIGLALCQRIIESHGGRIWVDTTYEEGTRIVFTLPATDERGEP